MVGVKAVLFNVTEDGCRNQGGNRQFLAKSITDVRRTDGQDGHVQVERLR